MKKISTIDNNVFASYSGFISDSSNLFDYVRFECQSYRYSLSTIPNLEYISKAFANRLQE